MNRKHLLIIQICGKKKILGNNLLKIPKPAPVLNNLVLWLPGSTISILLKHLFCFKVYWAPEYKKYITLQDE